MRTRSLALPLLALGTLGCAAGGDGPVAADAVEARGVGTGEATAPEPGPAQNADVPQVDAAAGATAELNDPGDALPGLARSQGAYYGSELEGFSAEDFYWMNREAGRWPDDLDPRDNAYLPSPEPNVTFTLDLGLGD